MISRTTGLPIWRSSWKNFKQVLDGNLNDGFSGFQQISKREWERRLQTNRHMIRQELCDALSFEKSNPLSDSKACIGIYPNTTRSTQSSCTEHISRLLEGRMKTYPKHPPQMNSQAKNPCATNSFRGLRKYVTELFGHEICDFFVLCWVRTSINHSW